MLTPPIPDHAQSLAPWMHLRSAPHIVPALGLLGFLTTPVPVAAVESVAGADEGGMLVALTITLLTSVTLAALVIIGLVFWSRKQEHIVEMMLFCMKYLVDSTNEAERCASAKALGRVKDPGALLVLVDVISDEEEPEAVSKAASEALHEMSTLFPKYKKVIADLESEAEQNNILGIIGILTAYFEQGKKRYVQSAYIIGRHYMRLGLYVDAREWLTKAEYRNHNFNLYGNRIRYWIQVCNTRLLEEADDAYESADYHLANEHYAVLDHGLTDAERQGCAMYLRSACVYCKLKNYRNADQSLLQALEHNHETDMALSLAPLLQEVVNKDGTIIEPRGSHEEIETAIDECSSSIMKALLAQDFLIQTTSSHHQIVA